MNIQLVPYLFLLLAILVGWRSERRIAMAFLGIALISGLAAGRLMPIALVWVGVLGLSAWLPTRKKLRFSQNLCLGIFLALAVALSNHWLPGFRNFQIFQSIQFSENSMPFTMYLNFDKTVVGLFIFLFHLKNKQAPALTKAHLVTSMRVLGLLVALLLPVALAIHYVRFDPKFPELGWVWMLNNLFFVCLAEEGLFRGFIQKGLSYLLPTKKIGAFVSVMLSAILFGLSHYKGGLAYVSLAAIAGLFYGYAYLKTNRIESAMLVHFGLNLIHFLFFSYPALAQN